MINAKLKELIKLSSENPNLEVRFLVSSYPVIFHEETPMLKIKNVEIDYWTETKYAAYVKKHDEEGLLDLLFYEWEERTSVDHFIFASDEERNAFVEKKYKELASGIKWTPAIFVYLVEGGENA